MLLSQEALAVGGNSKTLKFQGYIQGKLVIILVDSKNSHSFINDKLAWQLKELSMMSRPIRVQVDNGQVIQCDSKLRQLDWSIQSHGFISNMKVLPMSYYDIVVGIDWLELHNPMRIDWLNKWMVVNLEGGAIQLHGLQPSLPEFSLVEVLLIQEFPTAYAPCADI
jgi:hypothetical protein